MEEMYRTHKEPAWGWIGVLLAAVPRPDRPKIVMAPRRPRLVTTD